MAEVDGNTVLADEIGVIKLPEGYNFEAFKKYRDRIFVVLKNRQTKVLQYFEIRAVSDDGNFKDFTFFPLSRKEILKTN